jgi:hypothetical protein
MIMAAAVSSRSLNSTLKITGTSGSPIGSHRRMRASLLEAEQLSRFVGRLDLKGRRLAVPGAPKGLGSLLEEC